MVQPSPCVFQRNCSLQQLSHLPWMMFWIQSNNLRRRCWRCVWRLNEERCVTMKWWWSSENWSRQGMNEKNQRKLRPNLVESMLSAGNARIWKYKMQFQYCRIQLKIIQCKNWKTHNTFHAAIITSSVPMELQSPAIVTLTLNDVLFSIKQFT